MKQSRIDFVGRSRTWAMVSAGLLLVAIIGILVRGLNLSIDFTGGTSFSVEGVTRQVSVQDLQNAVEETGAQQVQVQQVGSEGEVGFRVRMAHLDAGSEVATAVTDTLRETTGVDSSAVSESSVGPVWRDEISRRALIALAVFLVAVVAYISWRLQWKMALAAIAALVHDILLTVGVYAWFGFSLSRNTVIALLTILGYSLYDSVVVFDRVEENLGFLGEPGRRTFQQVVNTSLNEVLWRSINTSLTSMLPVGGLLFIGAGLLGAGTLQDMAIALFVGMGLGTYSSLFVAGPLLAWWRGREPEFATLAKRREDAGEDAISPDPEAATAARRPITTEYVRGPGRKKRS